ncbi:MAG: ABC transporter permease [Synergistaceae bacterium]|jgi:peptide/nickel transport system permease protein|nr:ABC transporter permease [Synergistaceae bacterium]
MFVYALRRLLQMIAVLLAVSLIVFLVMSFTGDPVLMMLPPDATDAQIAEMRRELGLDRPLWVQYGFFVADVLRGNFGKSYIFKQPVLKLIVARIPATLEMVFLALLIAVAVAIPSGVYAGAKPDGALSRAIMTGSLFGISLPSFWVGILLIFTFAVQWGLLPSSGRGETGLLLGIRWAFMTQDGRRHLILPAVTLALGTTAMLLRLVRAQMREVMRQDFIKFARAKGVPYGSLLFSHAVRNALIPVVTVFGLETGNLIAFATVTETIFSWPGMGKLLVDSINTSDRPVIVAYLMIVAAMFVGINFTVDMIYTSIDPRIDLR